VSTTHSIIPQRFLRLRDVCTLLGVGASTVWRMTAHTPGFPQPLKPLGPNSKPTAWDADEIAAWQKQRIAERDRHKSRRAR